MNKKLITYGLSVAVLGVIFALLPHEVHMSLGGHQNHSLLVNIGWTVAVIGLGTVFAGWKIWD